MATDDGVAANGSSRDLVRCFPFLARRINSTVGNAFGKELGNGQREIADSDNMSAISTFPHFSSRQTVASRAPATGRVPSQGGVLTHTLTKPKMHTMYYGVQSAVFTSSTGRVPQSGGTSGAYRTGNGIRLDGPRVTQASLGKTYGRTSTPTNPNTGNIKGYGDKAAYTKNTQTSRPWETAGAVISSNTRSSVIGRQATPVIADASCIPCRNNF